jgi:hypothetical protein
VTVLDAGDLIAVYAALLSTGLGVAQLVFIRREQRRQQALERRDYRTDLELQGEVRLIYRGGQLFKQEAESVAASVSLRVENVSRQAVVISFAAATLDRGDQPPVTGMLKAVGGADGVLDLAPARVANLKGDFPLDWSPNLQRLGTGSPMWEPIANHGLRSLHISVMTPEREFKLTHDLHEHVIATWGGPSTPA